MSGFSQYFFNSDDLEIHIKLILQTIKKKRKNVKVTGIFSDNNNARD